MNIKVSPDDIPINTINIRGPPQSLLKTIVDKFINNEQSGLNVFDQMQQQESPIDDNDDDDEASKKFSLVDDEDINGLNIQISEGDQIAYGPALDDIIYYVEVDKEEKLYSIDDQLQDLQDDILSTIPSTQRNYQTNLEINKVLNRFKELREKFSLEENGILKPKRLSGKPLINNIQDGVKWLIPIVRHEIISLTDEEWIEQHEKNKHHFETSNDSNNRYQELLENLKYCDNFKPKRFINENLTEYIPNTRTETFYTKGQKNNRFDIQAYLPNHYKTLPSGEKIIKVEGDLLIPTAFIQTPILHIDYTRTSLLQTDLLVKSIKPSVNLWELLSNDDINPNIIELNNDILQRNNTSSKYFSSLTHHLLLNNNIDDKEKFSKIMNAIVPKTNDIISNMTSYYRNVYNVQSFIEHLHLFKIDEITRSNQQLIIKAINSNIKAYNDDRKNALSAIKTLATTKYDSNFKKQILDVLLQSIKTQIGEITKAYGFGNMDKLSNSEIFNEIMKQDNFYLLSIIISNLNAGLLITNNVNEIIEEHKLQLKAKYTSENDVKNKKCQDYIIAKKYNSQEELDQDNGGAVAYYDLEYDSTPYILKDDYYTEISTLTDEEAIVFIQKKLIENLNMSESNAFNTAKIIFDGKKPIPDGLYAILDTVDETTDKLKRSYFVRKSNMWVDADIDDASLFVSSNRDFCNLQNDCLTTNKGCVSNDNAINHHENNFAEDIMSDFNVSDINLTKEALQDKFNQQYAKQIKTIVRLREIKNNNKLIYDRQQKINWNDGGRYRTNYITICPIVR